MFWWSQHKGKGLGGSCPMLALVVVVGALGGVLFAGCASKAPESPAPPTKTEVQSDSDRFFLKMKEEEVEHGKQGER